MARRRPPPLLLAAAALLLLLRPRGAGAPMLTTEAYGFEMPWERVSGSVEACCASVEDVQRDHERTDALLRSIVERPFFRIFKVNLERPCQFFPDDGTCGRESCAVAECCEEEVPAPWRSGSAPRTCSAKPQRSAAPSCGAGENDVDFTLLTSFHGFDTWDGPDVSIVQGSAPDAWAAGLPLRGGLAPLNASSSAAAAGERAERELSSRDGAMSYVNLQQNPEKYTGYVGETATRIWAAICKPRYFFIDLVIALLAAQVSLTRERYGNPDEENCFAEQDGGEHCFEQRAFYRLMSGLHTSINTHLSRHFYPNDSPNLLLWQHKVGMHPVHIPQPLPSDCTQF